MMKEQVFLFDQFMERRTLDPQCTLIEVRDLLTEYAQKSFFIAGGSVVRTLLNLPLSTDIDVFFTGPDHYNRANSNLRKSGDWIDVTPPVNMNINPTYKHKTKAYKVQLIKTRFYPTTTKVLDSFDLTICQCLLNDTQIHLGPYTQNDLALRLLNIHNYDTIDPGKTVMRLLKYASLGFKILPHTYKQLDEFVNKTDSPIDLSNSFS